MANITGPLGAGTSTLLVKQGTFDADPMNQINNNFNALFGGQLDFNLVAVAANQAIDPTTSARYMFTKAGVATVTVAAPVSGVGDGILIAFTNTTTDQDVVTFTGGTLNSGAAGATTATFPAHAGGTLVVFAYQAKWYILSNNLVVIT
jgi:hypothetical protein